MLSRVQSILKAWSIPTASFTLLDLKKGQEDIHFYCDETLGNVVNEDTIWSICSLTKLITVFAVGILVDAGKLRWDSKLCELVPGVDLRDKHANDTLTLEDVLCHSSGIPG